MPLTAMLCSSTILFKEVIKLAYYILRSSVQTDHFMKNGEIFFLLNAEMPLLNFPPYAIKNFCRRSNYTYIVVGPYFS
jgi:hypothetical protein